MPLLSSIDHNLAIGILLEESHEKVPEGGLLIFMGFFAALKIHSQHQTAQNIPPKRKAHPQINNKRGYYVCWSLKYKDRWEGKAFTHLHLPLNKHSKKKSYLFILKPASTCH